MRRSALCLLTVVACGPKPTVAPSEPAASQPEPEVAGGTDSAPTTDPQSDGVTPAGESDTTAPDDQTAPPSDGTVAPAKVAVKGALDKDVIRRVVRSHINAVRACYTEQLKKDPELAGTVSIQFTIAPSGNVKAAVVNSTTLDNREVGQCIAKDVEGWQFPKPAGGGTVVVTYPFVLAPG